MTSAFSWQNSVSLCPASFCIPRTNLPAGDNKIWHIFFFKSGIGAYDSIYKNSFLLVFIHCFDKYILSVYHVLDFVVMVYIDLKFATYSREHCIFKNIFVFN